MEGDHIKINYWLLPLSWLYGLVVSIRNLMFDVGMLKSKTFPLPVICVGNITVGGTGKTPHTEYLIRLAVREASSRCAQSRIQTSIGGLCSCHPNNIHDRHRG